MRALLGTAAFKSVRVATRVHLDPLRSFGARPSGPDPSSVARDRATSRSRSGHVWPDLS